MTAYVPTTTTPDDHTEHDPVRAAVRAAAARAKEASRTVASLTRADKDAALLATATALEEAVDRILTANAEDVARAEADGTSSSLVDRLRLTGERVAGIASGLRQVAALPDPVGTVVRGQTMPNGVRLQQVAVPLGVMGVVYEARPNVTVDAFGLALKSGNAVLLRGSRSAASSNSALVDILREALAASDLPRDAVQLLPSDDRSSVTHLIQARGLVDVVIPRGGAGLINAVVLNATVPTIETGTGNCHFYLHASADLDEALPLLLNGKTRRPSVCNATETALIDRALDPADLLRVLRGIRDAGVTIHAVRAELADALAPTGPEAEAILEGIVEATDVDWEEEYLSMDLAVALVDGVTGALDHVARYSSGHTEAIAATDLAAAQAFVSGCDSAAVFVNTSTAWTDGEQFGFGAEIGISTQKIHARGPMGLPELTTTTWVGWGAGQTRP